MQTVAIAGFGVEGRAAYRYYKKQGARIAIFDQNPINDAPGDAEVIVGKDVFQRMQGFDLVLRGSPAIRPDAIKTDAPVTSVTKEFFATCPAPIIGVTGTKGKGTTASLVQLMLQRAGKTVHLVGNIGVPALDELENIRPDDVVVYELSSFQLWDLDQSPHIAIVLMMEPEHLDVHRDVDEYVTAKSQISAYQQPDDVTIYLPGNPLTERAALQGKGKKIPFMQAPGAHIHDGRVVIENHEICRTDEVGIPGEHNLQNICAAVTAAWQYTQDVAAIGAAAREFGGLPHHLEFASEVAGVRYYDDSFATAPAATIAAVRAFEQPKIVILGGSEKGADFSELARELARQTMRRIIVIGATQTAIHRALQAAKVDETIILVLPDKPSMTEIVARAAEAAQPGDVVLLSPACASLDMFKNYKERGNQFIAAVRGLGE